ncbi:MAG: ThuA domain-containing protein [Clostridia bacterium]|nr:ThuA domain-containing protein [Clostridia bacterium]
MEKIRVLVWNEYLHEQKSETIAKVYPKGIHGAIAEGLEKFGCFDVKCATLDMPECGLDEETLNNTDVLIWWSHIAHSRVPDEIAERVKQRTLDGMGFIPLHSSHLCKPFVKLMGTCCRSKWRENDEKERIWVIEPAHPIARNLPEYIELPEEETYGERFEIPTPDELVFISWFAGGEVFRSGCCWKRGLGKIFYFRPGHEAYPTYYREDIRQVLANAVCWAHPSGGPVPTLGNVKTPYESIKITDHSEEYHP